MYLSQHPRGKRNDQVGARAQPAAAIKVTDESTVKGTAREEGGSSFLRGGAAKQTKTGNEGNGRPGRDGHQSIDMRVSVRFAFDPAPVVPRRGSPGRSDFSSSASSGVRWDRSGRAEAELEKS